ncbi:MAG TPA: putative DNA-binding domain-containing protein [Woeseiaceae bacterium]|nr:putative DNA-binding domain-containing protein [Woeseiaceae bacterium]
MTERDEPESNAIGTSRFQRRQLSLAAHIRDPENNPAPEDIEDRRLAIYRELFANNLGNLLGSSFPVLRKLHGAEKWKSLVRDFLVRHRAHTPYFLEIPREFLDYLEYTRGDREGDYPFLLELAHYEWAELALSVSDAKNDLSGIDPDGDLLDGVPVKSVLAWALSYNFPVHRISPEFIPREAGQQPTHLVVFRKADEELEFRELNPVTARLLHLIGDDGRDSGRSMLSLIASEIGFGEEAMMQHGGVILRQMRADGILVGSRAPPSQEQQKGHTT